MLWCFNTPKAGPIRCVTSPIQKEQIKIVVFSILNVLDKIESFQSILLKTISLTVFSKDFKILM